MQHSLSIQNFNNRVRQMNQTNSKQLMLSSEEARSIHADIFSLLSMIAELQNRSDPEPVNSVFMDGGGFK
jgi:hypothetical protein